MTDVSLMFNPFKSESTEIIKTPQKQSKSPTPRMDELMRKSGLSDASSDLANTVKTLCPKHKHNINSRSRSRHSERSSTSLTAADTVKTIMLNRQNRDKFEEKS